MNHEYRIVVAAENLDTIHLYLSLNPVAAKALAELLYHHQSICDAEVVDGTMAPEAFVDTPFVCYITIVVCTWSDRKKVVEQLGVFAYSFLGERA